jgi:hypothetical protein
MAVQKQTEFDLARFYFVERQLPQAEVLEKVRAATGGDGITQRTLTRWIDEYGWHELRAATSISRPNVVRMLLLQINSLNHAIAERDEGQRHPTTEEADTLIKLASTIEKLTIKNTLAEVITVIEELIIYANKNGHTETVKTAEPLLNEFIQQKQRQQV